MSVIPANAGVILFLASTISVFVGYPRECGGDPKIAENTEKIAKLSPRMRG